MTIKYSVEPFFPAGHVFQVALEVSNPDPEGQVLSLPAWIPGSYMIRDFAKNILTLEASSSGRPIKVEKLDKQTWRCEPVDAMLQLVYRVYAWDLSVRSAHLDTTHGYFNGTSLFLRVVGQEQLPVEVELLPPADTELDSWQVATTLTSDGAEPLCFGRYRANDYQDLIDHPVEMGTFTHLSFEAGGVPHEIAITGRHKADDDRLCRDLQTICNHHIDFFGELPKMERYLFQIMVVGKGYGGLEHRSSTSLLCSRDDLPKVGQKEASEGYRQLLGLCSHEYFHLWNVKRIRPSRLAEADLSQEVHTSLLWWFEGVTSYYDDLSLVRSGCITPNSYLELLAQMITRVMRGSGRHKQTLEESSFDAWTKFYKQDENAPNAIVSYYTKGALAALALDLTLRERCGDRCSLDQVTQALWRDHGRSGVGVEEHGLEAFISEVAGIDLSGFFDLALRSTDELPLESLLGSVGIEMRLRPARDHKDRGGVDSGPAEEIEAKPTLGAAVAAEGSLVKLTQVFDDGAAQAAGLSAGDLLLAVDGIKVSMENLERLVADLSMEEAVAVYVFRRDELMKFTLGPKLAPTDTCELRILEEVDESIKASRNAWLKGV